MSNTSTIIKPAASFSLGLGELWQFRELLYFFAWRDIKIRYKQTFIGIGWALLQPVLLMGIFVLVFSRTSIGRADMSMQYEVFVLSGLLLWQLFYNTVSHAAEGMISNSNIIRRIYFPKILLPLSALAVALLDFLIAALLLLAACFLWDQQVSFAALYYFPLGILICMLTATGTACLFGALNIKYRDFRYALPFLLQLLFFASLVIYPASIFRETWVQRVLAINPLNAALELFRSGFHAGTVDPAFIWTGGIAALVIFFTGIVYFKKTEAYFADII